MESRWRRAVAGVEPAIGTKAVLEDRYPERRVVFPGGVAGLPDLVYSTVAGFRPLTLDLYLPPKQVSGGAPVIIYVHGGGWMSGHTRHSGAFETGLACWPRSPVEAMCVASLNYRLSSEAPSPAAEQDIKSAVRWLRGNAARFGVDKRHFGIWGGSAGGQLAALAGTSCGVSALEPSPVADAKAPARVGLCEQGSCTDTESSTSRRSRRAGLCRRQSRAIWAATTVLAPTAGRTRERIRHIDRNDPPFLLIHGALDKTVAPSQSERFHAPRSRPAPSNRN